MRVPLSRGHFVATLIILFVVVGNIWSWCTEIEYWPFSGYPMYASPLATEGFNLRLLAVIKSADSNNSVNERTIEPKHQLYPLDTISLYESLHRKVQAGESREIEAIVKKMRFLYASNQKKDLKKGEKIEGLVLYRDDWKAGFQNGRYFKKIVRTQMIAHSLERDQVVNDR